MKNNDHEITYECLLHCVINCHYGYELCVIGWIYTHKLIHNDLLSTFMIKIRNNEQRNSGTVEKKMRGGVTLQTV